jgi:hypothetical protein
MTPEVNTAIRKAQVEEAFWRFFTVYRLQVADCTANQNMLEEALEDKLLPITFENVSTLWESLTLEQKSAYAGFSGGTVKPRRENSQTTVKTEDVLAEMNLLPEEWTPLKIRKAERDEYKALLKKYGQVAINDRLQGRS